jgi:hypothetical protein
MAVWHIKATGTRASGASTAGNWDDANCYALVSGIDDTVLAGGDSIIFDDTDHIFGATVTLNSMPTAGTIAWSSRSSDSGRCRLVFTELASCTLLINNNIAAQAHTFTDLTITVRGTHVGAATRRSATMQFSLAVTNVTFTRCVFADITCDWSLTTAGVEGVLLDYNVASSGSKTLLFDSCRFEDITLIGPVAGMSAINGRTGCTVQEFRDCSFHNFAVTEAGGTHGVFRTQSGQLKVTRCKVSNVTVAGDNWDGFFFHTTAGITARFDTVDFARCTINGSGHPAMITVSDPFWARNLSGADLTFNNSDNASGLGGVFLAAGALAQGSINGLVAINVKQHYGAGAYFSNGAGGSITDFYCFANEGRQGAGIYIGGMDSRVKIARGIIHQCRQTFADDEGSALYVHQNATATSNREVDIAGVEVSECAPFGAGSYPVRLSAQDTGSQVTYRLFKCAIRNSRFAAGEIEAHALTSCTNVYSVKDCNLRGSTAGIVETGSGTKTGTVTGTTDTAITAPSAPVAAGRLLAGRRAAR